MRALAESMTICADAAERCLECGSCERVQNEGCGCQAGMWGPFATRAIEQAGAGIMGKGLERDLFTCALCGACTTRCPVGIDAPSVVRDGRAAFHELNPNAADQWRPIQADLAGNVFSKLRAWRGIAYDDALVKDGGECASLFFPGCTLSTYAPELTELTWELLRKEGLAQGITALCCGKLLWSIGLVSRTSSYMQALDERFAALGVRRIIAGCPNCYQALAHAQEAGQVSAGIELCALPRVLADAGLRIRPEVAGAMTDAGLAVATGATAPGPGPAAAPTTAAPQSSAAAAPATTTSATSLSFTVHDSCPDRETLLFGNAVREMLPQAATVEMRHSGRDTLCCGSGGTVSYYDTDVCNQRRSRRVAEFEECGADYLVTSCTSCVNSFVRVDPHLKVRHYLELIFDREIDWQVTRDAMAGLADAGGYRFAQESDNSPILA